MFVRILGRLDEVRVRVLRRRRENEEGGLREERERRKKMSGTGPFLFI